MTGADVGPRLRALRKDSGLPLRDVAARSGVSISYLSDVERARTVPSLETLGRIAAVYGCAVEVRIAIAPPPDDPRPFNGGY